MAISLIVVVVSSGVAFGSNTAMPPTGVAASFRVLPATVYTVVN